MVRCCSLRLHCPHTKLLSTMKTSALLIAASVASASAFVPAAKAPQTTQLNGLFKTISDMDLWAPVKDSNDYGARGKKNIKTGTLTDKSYVPYGLTKAQYEKIRAEADKKKDANYQKNVAKAGKFIDFTDFYLKRGTGEGGNWLNAPNRGHLMAKTKYDWSGEKNETPMYTGVRSQSIVGNKSNKKK
jgi:hypothetical protein